MELTGRLSRVASDGRPVVQVQSTVTISDDLDELLPRASAIGGRYMGADLEVTG